MTKKKKIVLAVVSVLLVLVLGGIGYGYYFLQVGLPSYTGEVSVEGLEEEVTVLRDERGVPHVQAENSHDLYFAQGYVQAQERLWQMEIFRRALKGKISEVVGDSTLDMDKSFRRMQLEHISEDIVEMTTPETIEVLQSYVDGVNAWLDKDELPPEIRLLGFEPEPWKVEDVIGAINLVAYEVGTNWVEESIRADLQEGLDAELFEEILPPYDAYGGEAPTWRAEEAAGDLPGEAASKVAGEAAGAKPGVNTEVNSQLESQLESELESELESQLVSELESELVSEPAPVEGEPAEANLKTEVENSQVIQALRDLAEGQRQSPIPRLGSNSWVISPELSATGHAVLANDPHVSLDMPPIWFENHLQMGDEVDLYGWSIPGAPGIVIGQNRHISWGITNIGDTQDLFLEEQHPDDPHKFRYDGEWYQAEVTVEEIEVSGQADPVEIEIITTRNGPLVSMDPPLSLKWTAHDIQDSTADAIMGINYSRNWEEFRQSLMKFTIPTHNVVYADKEGNIGFRIAGQIPIRKKGDGLVPAPGWDPDYGWDGYVPMDELPELYNPESGFIATANQQATCEEYPYSIAIDAAPPYRMKRITDVLQSQDSFEVEDFMKLQNDWYNRHADAHLPEWVEILEDNREQLDDRARHGVDILKEWAGEPVNRPEEPGPAIFQIWYLNFMEEIFADTMGDELYQRFIESAYLAYNAMEKLLLESQSPWWEPGKEKMLLASYENTIEELTADQGGEPSNWEWQEIQEVELVHLMSEVELLRPLFNRGPYPYGGDHMTVGRSGYSLTDPFKVDFGDGLRYIAVMKPEVESWAVLAGGQSGHPRSEHYDDQVEAWLEGDYYRLLTSPEQVKEKELSRLTLVP